MAEMGTRITKRRCSELACAMSLLLFMAAWTLQAETLRPEAFEGCSWTGPEPDWTLDRTIQGLDSAGSLNHTEIIRLFHDSGVSISLISEADASTDVGFQSSEPVTARELIDEILTQNPDYRLGLVSGRLLIYPSKPDYDALIEIGDTREVKRVVGLSEVLRELRAKSPVLSRLRLPTLRPFGTFYRDLISVGGARTVVEHLVSLVAGGPSANFVILPGADGSMQFSLLKAHIVEEFFLEMPEKVKIGAEFRVVPRVNLVDGMSVTLIGSGCGVYFESNDDSILTIDQGGRATAVGQGTVWLQAKYEGSTRNVEIQVDDN
jgi:hypothetical protein